MCRRFLPLLAAAALLAGCSGGATPAARPDSAHTAAPTPASPSPAPSPSPRTGETAGFGEPERVGRFDATALPEASGLAASRRTPGVLYLLDDAAGTSGVLAVHADGTPLGTVGVAGLDLRDGEGLAVGPCGEGEAATCLYIGDIGGNREARDEIRVWRVTEPDLAAEAPSTPLPGDVVTLRYPDTAHDAEALLVDADGSPFVVTKTAEAAPQLFGADGFGDQVLTDHGPLALPEPRLPLASAVVGNVVTAGDVRDGRVLLRTYDAAFLYDPPGGRLATLATSTPTEVPAPFEPQGEAIAWAADGCGYLTVGEGVGDIWHVPCRDPLPAEGLGGRRHRTVNVTSSDTIGIIGTG